MEHPNFNQLIELLVLTSEQGRKGFAEAAEEATRPELKSLFRQRSIDCGTAGAELRSIKQSLGSLSRNDAAGEASDQAGWIKLKTATGDANMAALEEVDRAQDKAEAVYLSALKAALPVQIQGTLQRQYDGMLKSHVRIRELRSHYQPATLPW